MSAIPTTTIYIRTATREKLKRIADIDRRDLVEQIDVMADDELKRRGLPFEESEPATEAVSQT